MSNIETKSTVNSDKQNICNYAKLREKRRKTIIESEEYTLIASVLETASDNNSTDNKQTENEIWQSTEIDVDEVTYYQNLYDEDKLPKQNFL